MLSYTHMRIHFELQFISVISTSQAGLFKGLSQSFGTNWVQTFQSRSSLSHKYNFVITIVIFSQVALS